MTMYRLPIIVISCIYGLSGCASLPAFGPSSDVIVDAAVTITDETDAVAFVPFDIVNISVTTIPQAQTSHGGFPTAFRGQSRAADEVIHIADVLEIRIWEVAEDGLFATSGQRQTLLTAEVSNSGKIEVPYAGKVAAAGISTSALRLTLLDRYSGQAIEPEIAVRISETTSRAATVLGDVRTPGRTDIATNGTRLLDVLAQVGGTPHPNWEVKIDVQRGGASASATLQEIVDYVPNNITIFPSDTVHVTHVPRRFAVYGALNKTGNIEVDVVRPTLSQLIAEAGGLDNMLAEPTSVFVFRNIPGQSAIAYRLDFASPDAFLLADRFILAPSDIIYVPTADASEFRKFVSTIVSPFFSTANGVSNLSN